MKFLAKPKKIWIPVAIALVGLIINIMFEVTGFSSISEKYNEVRRTQYSVAYGTGVILYGFLVPFAEEIVFRFICFNLLKKWMPVIPSILLSAIIFGVYHGNLVQGVYAFLMGTLLATSYYITKDFKVPIASHGLSNILMFTITMYM